jgi:hypothetical protein
VSVRRHIVVMIVALVTGRAAHADDARFTATLDFSAGSTGVGPIDGFTAPDGHLDFGVARKDLRLQLELDVGLWTDGSLPETVPNSGTWFRIGSALRWHWTDFGTPDSKLRAYVEAGVGRQWIFSPVIDLARDDVAIGFGLAQEARMGRSWLGGHTGVRALFSDGVTGSAARVACRGTCSPAAGRIPDVAIFYVLGVVFGR